MSIGHYQEEETYLFSTLLDRIRNLSRKKPSLTTKCLLSVFWRIYDDEENLIPLLEDLEKEIDGYDPDPTRESNRTKKVFACAIYRAVSKSVKYEEKVQDYILYALNSDWLGQPRIACCVSFLKNELIADDAEEFLRKNYGTWLSDGREDFLAISLLALNDQITQGELQRTIEHIEPRIDDLPLNISSLFLIGISQSNAVLPNKDDIEDRLYQSIRSKLTDQVDEEGLVTSAAALLLAKYHKISGFFEKYSSEIGETLNQKKSLTEDKKKVKARSLLLCITSIAFLALACLIFYIPTFISFKDNSSAFGKILLALNAKKGWALASTIGLATYILISYFKMGDPVFGIVEYLRGKLPVLFKTNKER